MVKKFAYTLTEFWFSSNNLLDLQLHLIPRNSEKN